MTTGDRSALVTGAGGFIGSHLTALLLQEGWRVRALVHYNGAGRHGWLEGREHPALEVVMGDVNDPAQMRTVAQGCDTIFHLAALIAIPYSYVAPHSYVQTNVVGTLNLLEAARQAGVGRFIHTSTSETYGTARYTPIDEQHPLQGQSPYSATKIGADKLVESYWRSFGLPAITVRPFNTYGPRQSARAVIPNIIVQALAGPEVKLGALDPVRDLTFVGDTAAGFLAAALAPAEALGQTINLGTGEAVTIGELAELIFAELGGGFRIVADEARMRPAQSEVFKLISDNRLAAQLVGWTPRIGLAEGLRHTIAWLREHRHLYRPREYAR